MFRLGRIIIGLIQST